MNRDQFGTLARGSVFAGIYAAGWLVSNTILPGWTQGFVATIVACVPIIAFVGLAHLLGLELTGGQCRAETNSEDRCSRSRPPNRDFCWQHRDLHNITLHPDGIDEKQREASGGRLGGE